MCCQGDGERETMIDEEEATCQHQLSIKLERDIFVESYQFTKAKIERTITIKKNQKKKAFCFALSDLPVLRFVSFVPHGIAKYDYAL